MKIDPADYLTVTNAAAIAGVSREWMRRLAQAGQVRAVCMDGLWFVHREEAERLKLASANSR